MSNLFEPLTMGPFELSNRVTVAAMTRSRAGESGIPTEMHAKYYGQRAGAGLVVTEGAFPYLASRAFPGQGGIETPEQSAGWAKVADAVHAAGGRIFMQMMHGGRISQPGLIDGAQTVGPSAVAPGIATRDFEARKECVTPRALELEELPQVIEGFRAAARRAVDAGIDGIEIHGANGYLFHQFLDPGANLRQDAYGGSPANRARLLREAICAIAAEIGPERTAVRLSPGNNVQGIHETDPADVAATYGGLLDDVADLGLAYVSFLHADPESELIADLAGRARANGLTRVLMNSGFAQVTQREHAEAMLGLDYVDAVAVGRLFISNPDLVRRWEEGLPLTSPDESTFYTGGERGYTDYPLAR